MLIDQKINNFMVKLGVSETETRIYLALLELGPASTLMLTQKTKIPRTTVRENIDKLIDKGLVTQTFKGPKKVLVAEEPNKAKLLLEERKLDTENNLRRLGELEESFPDFLSAIQKAIPKAIENTEVTVRYYEGKKEVMSVYYEIMHSTEVYSFADLQRYHEIFPGTLDLWKDAFAKNPKRQLWDILVDSEFNRQEDLLENKSDQYHYKFLPVTKNDPSFNFSDLSVYDNSVAVIQLTSTQPKAIVIEGESISMSIRAIHRYMWDLLS